MSWREDCQIEKVEGGLDRDVLPEITAIEGLTVSIVDLQH
jgi:hypothetical protein